MPVFNLRKRFRLPERDIDLSDQFILARTSKRKVVLAADSVTGVIEMPGDEVITPDKILPVIDYVEGIIKPNYDSRRSPFF